MAALGQHQAVAVVQVPHLLTVATAARILGRSPRTIRRRIHDGTLPAVIDHGTVMIRADELRDYIDRLDRPARPTGKLRPSRPQLGEYDFLRG